MRNNKPYNNHRRGDPYEGTYLTGKNLFGVFTIGAIGISAITVRRLGLKSSLVLGSYLAAQMAGPSIKTIRDIISLTLNEEAITKDEGINEHISASAMSIELIKYLALTNTNVTVFGRKKRRGEWHADRQLQGKLFHLKDDSFLIKDRRNGEYLTFRYEDIFDVVDANGDPCLILSLPYKV